MFIPKEFLRKILKRLEQKKFIKLKRGAGGGVKLIKSPKRITIYDVIVAFEGKIALNRCVINKKVCSISNRCPVHPIWINLRRKLIESLREISFSTLNPSKKFKILKN